MMPFAEKLSFLMHITETTNKELAIALSVDPSLISLMRTGKRKLSKNPLQSRKMALFFARRCPAAFQRQALSEMLDQTSISLSMPVDELANSLECWLRGDMDMANTILSSLQTLPLQPNLQPQADSFSAPSPVSLCTSQNHTMFFYGENGRREAMTRVFQEIQSMKESGSILTVVDDNLDWLLSDFILSKKIQSGLMDAIERGFVFHQIMPPLNYINRYTESLKFWIPIYATGKTNVYYYPRLRGNLYRHSIVVVPGCCVQYASSVSIGSTSDITMFSTDLKLVSAFEKQFHEHLSLCRPSLHVNRNPSDFVPCFLDFFSHRGDTVQEVNSLSINTMPRVLLERLISESPIPKLSHIFQMYLDEMPRFEERFSQEPYIDMCYLASAEDVRAGIIPIAAPLQADNDHPCYTPETYCLHLRNIIHLMDRYPNYSFLPLHEFTPDYNLFVNEGGAALLVRTIDPILLMEIRRPAMITAFWENQLRKAESLGYDGIHREKIRMTLRSLIQELDG